MLLYMFMHVCMCGSLLYLYDMYGKKRSIAGVHFIYMMHFIHLYCVCSAHAVVVCWVVVVSLYPWKICAFVLYW